MGLRLKIGPCAVFGCGRPAEYRGYCPPDYQALYRAGELRKVYRTKRRKTSGWSMSERVRYSVWGHTPKDWKRELETQDNSCAICLRPFSSTLKPMQDHNHETNELRGILCHHCNVALG